jgi:ribonuclease G
MKRDRAKHTILPPSKFGLVQITRQRVFVLETNITTVEKMPACDGTGEDQSQLSSSCDEIENNLRYFVKEQNEKSLNVDGSALPRSLF